MATEPAAARAAHDALAGTDRLVEPVDGPARRPSAAAAPLPVPAPMPPAEVSICAPLVRRLLREAHPHLADLPLRRVAFGWDNVIYRLGPRLSVRLPRRQQAVELLRTELTWLPTIAPGLPVPAPVPVAVGGPAAGYPWPWAVCRWVPGRVATRAPLAGTTTSAQALVALLAALHHPAPATAPANPYRGTPLAQRAPLTLRSATAMPHLWTAHLQRLWRDALDAPPHPGSPVWLHGDPHPANLLTRRGRLAGVIDFGDMCAGDPATDLAVAWLTLPLSAHGPLHEYANALDPSAWARARGWAIALSLAIAAHSADHPDLAGAAAVALARLGEQAG